MQTLAAVDIGSNAIRIHIVNLLTRDKGYEFKTLEYIRVPLRLGEDVFREGKISEEKLSKLLKLGLSLVNFFALFDVQKYKCCATSAMREAANGREVVRLVKEKTGFEISVIDGDREAELTALGLKQFIGDGTWVHVDVGGGSTEINIYKERKRIASRSFRIGAVRMLMKEDIRAEWEEVKPWIEMYLKEKQEVTAIGTGGNIGKIHEMSKVPSGSPVEISKIREITSLIASYSKEDRIQVLKLNPDRADVILPSSEIYLHIMECAGANLMYAPKTGLTEGIFEELLQQD